MRSLIVIMSLVILTLTGCVHTSHHGHWKRHDNHGYSKKHNNRHYQSHKRIDAKHHHARKQQAKKRQQARAKQHKKYNRR